MIPLCVVVLASLATPATYSSETNSLLDGWLAAQPKIQTWAADFVQTRTLRALTQPLMATGHVWFAEPNRFRWELGRPPQTIAVREPEAMLVIYPNLKRVERYPLNSDQAGPWRDALALIEAGFPRTRSDLESRFRILSQTAKADTCEIALQPRAASARRMMPQIKIVFGTNDLQLHATELQFADGSTLRNDFTNAVLNPSIDAAMFMPEIANDFKVVEPLKPK